MEIQSDKETIICQSSQGWVVNSMGNTYKHPLKLTNKQLILGDNGITFNLKDMKMCLFKPMNIIEITLTDRTERLKFTKQSVGHAIDQFASAIMGEPFEAGSWQEEVSSYTSYWASMITMAISLYGNPVELSETVIQHSERRAYCNRCKKYVFLPWSDEKVWTLSCPECGRRGMTTLSPEDRN